MIPIHHCVEESNVDEDLQVTNPFEIKHVVLLNGEIESISGKIDPKTHLNLDFSNHQVSNCVITEKFEKGAKIKFSRTGFAFANVKPSFFKKYGNIDHTKRYQEIIDKVRDRKNRK